MEKRKTSIMRRQGVVQHEDHSKENSKPDLVLSSKIHLLTLLKLVDLYRNIEANPTVFSLVYELLR